MTRNEFREIIIEKRPFTEFDVYCEECGDNILDETELTDSPLKDEVLMMYRIRQHTIGSDHTEITVDIQPRHAIRNIDATINVNKT